jgi:hypothetical protein
MENLIYYLAYFTYVIVSSCLAYPLLKRKSQHPKKAKQFVDMLFFNTLLFGALPLVTLLMKLPPEPNASRAEIYDYYEKRKIWKWNK